MIVLSAYVILFARTRLKLQMTPDPQFGVFSGDQIQQCLQHSCAYITKKVSVRKLGQRQSAPKGVCLLIALVHFTRSNPFS